MAGFGAAPTLIKVVLILALVATLIDLLGFALPYFQSITYRYEDYNAGLWKYCSTKYRGVETCSSFHYPPSWFQAVQAFETLGFIAAIVALVLIVLYVFVPATSGKRIVFILTMLACFVAAGCIILGIIIYGSKVESNLSWSFALCTIAGIIFGICGIILVIDMMKR